jgi:hypothetical protein
MANGKLEWNGTEYEADYDGEKKLYVDGDAFAESRMDLARQYMSEAHPEMSMDEVIEALSEGTEEGDAFYDKAFDETLDAFNWQLCAVEVDENGDPINPNDDSDYCAWIQ